MTTINSLEIVDGFYGSFDESITFEKIRHHRDGKMPVGRSAAATRSSRRQDRYRQYGRKSPMRID